VHFEIDTSPIADDHALLITVSGELDIDSCRQLNLVAAEALSVRRPVILDMSACLLMDSSGARSILELYNGLNESESPLPMGVVAGQSAITLFTLTAIHPSIPLFETLGKALEWLDTARRSNGLPSLPTPGRS
jgi:anti-anti-sigma factor